MGKITAIRDGRGRSERVNVFIDGEFAFGLEAEVVVQEKNEKLKNKGL